MAPRLEPRILRVEGGLGPTELVVRWLDDAHAAQSLDAYVTTLLDERGERWPLTRLLREAQAYVRTGAGRRRGEELDQAVRKALRETAFRFELVLRINVTTHELIEREALRHFALSAHLALLALDRRPTDRPDPSHDQRLSQCLAIADRSVTELLASEQARTIVEARYLAGHPALFPDEATRFTRQLGETQRQTVLAFRLAELDGLSPGEPGRPDAVAARAETLVTNLVEPARVTALEKLDDGRLAFTIATDWLRATTAPGSLSEGAAAPTL